MASVPLNRIRLLRALTLVLFISFAFYNLVTGSDDDLSLSSPEHITDDKDSSQPELDGFNIDSSLGDSINDEFFAKEEASFERKQSDGATVIKEQFGHTCPYGFFKCNDGECISPRWHCDGAYDCNDFSDELNCTKIADSKAPIILIQPEPVRKPPHPKHTEHIKELTFNSSVEPLMLFSTGLSIRGLWMKRQIYFDVVSLAGSKQSKVETPSISQALSVFFDLLNIDRQTSSTPKSITKEHDAQGSSSRKPKSTIVGIDMDAEKKEVYWVELGANGGVFSTIIENEQFESRHRRQFMFPRPIVDSGLIAPEDVAIDHLGKNLYITDAGLPAIVVCSIKHSHCKILINSQIHKPRAILVDSSTGWLTYSDWGDHPGIYLVTMDGKRREVLVDTEVVWPNGLAADYPANQLYWADARLSKIERVDLATRKRKIILQEKDSNPFSLALFENRLYWSDWSGNEIKTCDKSIGNNSTKSLMNTDNLYGIHIYHPTLVGSGNEQIGNPCWSDDCTHICLLSPASSSSKFSNRKAGSITSTCACPDSMGLSVADKSSCYELRFSFLLINVKNYIAQVFPDRIGLNVVEKVIYSKDHIIHDVTTDWSNRKIFFFDAAKQQIYLAEISEKVKVSPFLPTSQSVRGLLYDGWSDNLYWLDSERGTMSIGSVKGKFETVIRKDLERPISMVLDSRHRVFYISMLGSMPHIIRTDIYGNEASDLTIIGTDIGLPVGLHLDEEMQRLYWADARRETIESLDLDITSSSSGIKSNSRIVHRKSLGTILAFAVYQNHFIWAIKNGDYLYSAKITNMDDNRGTSTTKPQETRPFSFKLPPNPSAKDPSSDNKRIIVVDPKVHFEDINSPCHSRPCSHGCVLDSSNNAVCICPEAYKLSTNKTSCIPAGHRDCGPAMFKCLDTSHCILNSWKCDGTNDCDDGSDEKECHLRAECPNSDFTCKNGHCISQAWRCDITDDCGDNSDEENCPKQVDNSCTVGYFSCGDGKCIPQLWRCDREKDCPHGNDETNCRTEECKPNFFRCKDNSCIPQSWLCDKTKDCPEGDDENNCADALCKPNEQFLCDKQLCLDMRLKCDGRKDCIDGTDEFNCTQSKTCPHNMVPCPSDHHCIYPHDKCDGHQDCDDGSDENNCPVYRACASYEFPCVPPSTSNQDHHEMTSGNATSHQTQHTKCIPKAWLCDGSDDCGDWSDELNEKCLPPSYDHIITTTSKPCHDGSFPCTSGECIKWSQVCDHEDNCLDGSDEGGKCLVSCSINNGGCAQSCRSSPLGPSCSCYDGYVMTNDTKTCQDVDECLIKGICSHYCHNFKGGYKCSCAPGYLLTPDHRRCKATGEVEPFILLMEPSKIISFGLSNLDENVLASNDDADISGLDFEFNAQQVFWSETAKGQILSSHWTYTNLANSHAAEPKPIEGHTRVRIDHLDRPKNLAFDWVTKNMYFSQSQGIIHVCNIETGKCSTLFESRIVNCHSIAVAPTVGFIFWAIPGSDTSNTNFSSGMIERAEMDGTHRKAIVTDKIHSPRGLTVDFVLERIYWTDLTLGEISSVDFAGRGRQNIVSYALQNPSGLSLFEDSLFVANIGSDSLMRCDKFYGNRVIAKNGGVKGQILKVVHQVTQPELPNPCFNTTCTHICAISNSTGFGCICPDGQVLQLDQRSCIPYILAESLSQQRSEPSRLVWVFIFLIPLSLAIIVVVSLFLYRQGRLPRQLSASFVSYDKDAMLLLDDA